MLEDVMRLFYEIFSDCLDSESLNALLRTSKTLGELVGGTLVQGLTLELQGNRERGTTAHWCCLHLSCSQSD